MRKDLLDALNRKWSNYLFSFGLIRFIENTLIYNNLENVLFATGATILSAGYIQNGKAYSYSENQNIQGLLVITNQCVLHFSKGERVEIASLDDTEIELKTHIFTPFIQLRSVVGFSYINIGVLGKKDFKTVSEIITYLIKKQEKLLLQRRMRKKR